jgi:hypothetical protein
MCDEDDLIEENHTWSLADLPAGKKPIAVQWVYKLKGDAASNILKHKARLVAKGYVELPGIDIDEVFALVACLDSVRLLLAVAAQFKWEVHHMDLKTTFVNGELSEEVYICQPPGFVNGVNSSKVLRLHSAPYGLRQAPRVVEHQVGCRLGVTWVRTQQVKARSLCARRGREGALCR